jgi:hypothetical protein
MQDAKPKENAMPADITSFYFKDPGSFALGVKTLQNETEYFGPERRMEMRRKARDRRVDVRFNLTKSDRRELKGRREGDAIPAFW